MIIKKEFVFLIVFAFMISINNALGQSHENEYEELTDSIVTLVREIDDNRVVILIENEDFIIKVALSDYEDNIRNWLKELSVTSINRFLYAEVKKLLDMVLNEAKSTDIVSVSKLTDRGLILRLEFRIASLLENGKCLILNNKSNELISDIKLQKYSRYNGQLHVCDGRRFYVNGINILETQDMVTIMPNSNKERK